VLKNYLVRLYERNTTRGFNAWLSVYRRHLVRDERLKRILIHYKRKLFGQITIMFKAHAAELKKTDKKKLIFTTRLLVEEQQNIIELNSI